MTTLTVEQLEKWYRKQLAKRSKDFVKQAEKSYRIVESALKDIQEVSKSLRDSDVEDSSDSVGIAARFAMKIEEIVNSFYVTKEISYESTEMLQEEVQRFIQELWGAGARWIRRMDKRHKGTIKQLDVYMKELAREMKRIGKLLYEFSWLKDLERIGTRIDTLRELGRARESFEEQIRQVRQKIEQARREYELAKQAYDEFTRESNVAELLNLDQEADHLAAVLRMKLNPLKKQVKKFLQHDHGVRVPPEGLRALTDYFEDPYTAIVNEPDGHPGLVEGLSALRTAIEQGRLPLKDRLARRAIEEIEAISRGSLRELQVQAKSIEERRRRFAGSDVYAENRRLQEALEEARKNLEYHTNDLLRIRDEIKRQLERIEEYRTRIESEILDAFGEKVRLKVDARLEPLLELCEAERGEAV